MPDISIGLDFAWRVAVIEAAHGRDQFVEPERLFIGVCKVASLIRSADWSKLELPENLAESLRAEAQSLAALFDRFHIDPVALYREVRLRKGQGNFERNQSGKISRSPASRAAFARAAEMAADAPVITSLHVLAALLDDAESLVVALLKEKDVDIASMRDAALALSPIHPQASGSKNETTSIRRPIIGQGKLLQLYGKDLTQRARWRNPRMHRPA